MAELFVYLMAFLSSISPFGIPAKTISKKNKADENRNLSGEKRLVVVALSGKPYILGSEKLYVSNVSMGRNTYGLS